MRAYIHVFTYIYIYCGGDKHSYVDTIASLTHLQTLYCHALQGVVDYQLISQLDTSLFRRLHEILGLDKRKRRCGCGRRGDELHV